MNILFFGAHPDDLEILCGGTIAACVAQGHRVTMAVATNGNVGSPTHDREEIASIRRREAEAAAGVLGAAELIWLDEDDEFLFDDKPTRLKFVDAIRRARAEVIVTHNPEDYHPDHNACSKLAADSRILSAVRLVETAHPSLDRVPELYYMDSAAGINFQPQFYSDITAFFEVKRKALLAHDSQNAWLRAIYGHELTDIMQTQSAFRGLQAGVKYAEAFTQPSYWPKAAEAMSFLRTKD
ncbi:MAG: PIG-L family deacetylase [Cupriavidus sp.]|nr:MAG: PIG-L family deacetylase [Cupriavidus sp.]